MSTKNLTYDEMLKLALDHYEKGGDGFVECWDEKMFDEYIEEFGPFTRAKALKMFKSYQACTEDMMGWYR